MPKVEPLGDDDGGSISSSSSSSDSSSEEGLVVADSAVKTGSVGAKIEGGFVSPDSSACGRFECTKYTQITKYT